MRYWQTTRFRLPLDRPLVMGIVNVTPDSFSDGGQHADFTRALDHCRQLVSEGADILDIGGESTRPGAEAASLQTELDRVLPLLREAIKLGVPVSIDTYKPEVMQAALDEGVDIVNDILALQRPGALDIVARHGRCGVCLMHMQGEPRSMQAQPEYADVVAEVGGFLAGRLAAAESSGISRDRITLDPGIGFGKSVDHNFALLARQRELTTLGAPLLLGWSRKSSLGAVTGRPVGERVAASVAAALAAVLHGAAVVRVHDVAATVDALQVWGRAGLPAALAP